MRMDVSFRIFFSKAVTNFFLFAFMAPLFLLLISCGFNKPSFVFSDFSQNEYSAPGEWHDEATVSAQAQVYFMTSDGYYPAKVALVMKRPSHLRLEILPIIGPPDFFLVASPETMRVFIPSRMELYVGKPSISNLKKFLPWSAGVEEIVMMLTGIYPALQENNVSSQEYLEGNHRRIEMRAPSGASQTVWRGENNKLLKFSRQDASNKTLYTADYSYNPEETRFPSKIVIKMSAGSTSLSVNYLDVQIEKTSDVSVFDLIVPEHVTEIIME
jgi:hypothetical protein